MHTDYLIIGGGLAGLCFASYCRQHDKTFLIIDSPKKSKSSLVAVGLYNPVVLKRFTAIWQADEQMQLAKVFYQNEETHLHANFYHDIPLFRKFANTEEQNDWFTACDKNTLAPYLNDKIIHQKISGVQSPLGYGEVHQSGYVDTKKFVKLSQQKLNKNNQLIFEEFDYDQLQITNEQIEYKNIQAKHIIFAEGFAINQNPYFNNLPLDGTKGEVISVRIPKLDASVILKSNIFVLPVGNDIYRVGATYDWKDKTNTPTEEGKKQLINDLKTLIDLPFELIDHKAGIRPTVRDRRPLVGTHHQHKNMHLLNGLGTRGVLLGPYLAKQLFDHIEKTAILPQEIDIKRYYKKQNLI